MSFFRDEWRNPPKNARPLVRWWWPGLNVEKEELIREITELDDHGFGGAEIQPFLIGSGLVRGEPEIANRFAPHPFYYEVITSVLETAAAHDMIIDLTVGSSWPPGGSTVGKDDSLQTLLLGTTCLRGPARVKKSVPPFQVNPIYKFKILRGLASIGEFFAKEFKPVATVAVRPLLITKRIKFIRPQAVPLDFTSAIDITSFVDDRGILNWEVPEGTWQIFTMYAGPSGMTPISPAKSAPDAKSLVVDMFNEEAITHLLNDFLMPGMEAFRPYLGITLRALFTDSQEIGGEWFWTTDFLDEFAKRRGYDVRPYLPACFVPNRDNQFTYVLFMNTKPCWDFPDGVGERMRYDWELTLSDLFAERYCGGVARWGKQYGLQHRIQTYGIRVDLLKAYGQADIPETEQLFAGGLLDFLKIAGSAGVIYNKPIVSAETLTAMQRDYMTTPLKVKVAVDRLFVAGINQVVYHGFSYFHPDAPYPGYYPWSPPCYADNLNHNNPFWSFFPQINAYIARALFLLRQGHTCCNVGVYYPLFNYDHKVLKNEDFLGGYLDGFDGKPPHGPIVWFLKKVRNKIDRLTLAQQQLGDELMAQGYYYVHFNEEALLSGQVHDGVFQVGVASLEVLIFPNTKQISLPAAEKIAEIARAGIIIIFYGDVDGYRGPLEQPGFLKYEKNDAKIREMLHEKFLPNRYYLASATNLADFLQNSIHITPGLVFRGKTPAVHYIHKETQEGDLYFLRSGRKESFTLEVGFPQAGKIPYTLDLWDGSTNVIIKYRPAGNLVWVAFEFAPYGSQMVLFAPQVPNNAYPQPVVSSDIPLYNRGGELVSFTANAGHYAIAYQDGTKISAVVPLNAPGTLSLNSWHLTVLHRRLSGDNQTIDVDLSELQDWRFIKELRYSSGPGTYTTTFLLSPVHISKNLRVSLKLGKIHDVASICINGHNLPPILVPPYEADISNVVQEGDNFLEVTVTATLRNLLVGYGKQGGKAWRHQKRRDLMPVGLIGPVVIEFQKIITYNQT
ncbi:MAG TPA: glycosyl hydrolase [Candidatus Lokiarchaeia archaeon]|nr:glycosyl hydrolase [Candidatus Lokiarchaeia archaeon]